MRKIDYKKQDKSLYQAKKDKVLEVNVPLLKFVRLEGHSGPNNSMLFSEACKALFSVSYKIKFAVKKSEISIDYGVMPLEGLWWVGDGKFDLNDKQNWKWILMIRQPEFVTQKHLDAAITEIEKKEELENLSELKLEEYFEGLSTQILHLGPYSEEQPTIDILHDYINKNDYTFSGKHHEIYLNDPTRTTPENLKTIIRQPIKG